MPARSRWPCCSTRRRSNIRRLPSATPSSCSPVEEASMPEAPPRTAIDDLLDQFVEALRPAHERHAAVPATAITVRKSELRDAAANLLLAHEPYLVGAAPVLSAALSREEVNALINRPGQIVRLSPDLTRMH